MVVKDKLQVYGNKEEEQLTTLRVEVMLVKSFKKITFDQAAGVGISR